MPGSAARAWQGAVSRAREPRGPGRAEEPERPDRPEWEPEVWVEDAEPPSEPAAREADAPRARPRRPLPPAVADELVGEVGPGRGRGAAARLAERLAEAARAYARERHRDALKIVRPLATSAPGSAAVRELHGLTLYQLGRWAEAARELEAFRSLSGSYDQHPTLADCYRALRRYEMVEGLWDELRRASPSAELVAEGRIVAAGAAADRGDVQAGIDLLERAPAPSRRPRDHHLRTWYALADLHERAGDLPKARDLFRRVAGYDPGLHDAAERASSLG